MLLLCNQEQRISSESHEPLPDREMKDSVETFTVNGVTFEMVRVNGSSFRMGAMAYNDEEPAHYENVPAFYIGRTEVTQALWKAVMGNNPSYFKGDTHPVERVSWYDCQEFVERLSGLTGCDFRLPTEAEWEFAARGNSPHKVFRGGCWYNSPTNCHVAFRFCHSPEKSYDNIGLRLAMSVEG